MDKSFFLSLSQLLFGYLTDVDDGHHCFFQTLNRTEFVGAVEVETSSKDIGAG